MKPLKENKNYLISTDGDVFSLKSNSFISPHILKIGYRVFDYNFFGKRKVKYVHRAVAELYLKNPDNKKEVNHKDGNKLNNSLSNLEWCTHRENILHAHKIGLCKTTDKQRENARQMGKSHSKKDRLRFAKLGGAAAALANSKPVVCLKTKKRFLSISLAAKSINMLPSTLARKLSGLRKNETSFVIEEKIK